MMEEDRLRRMLGAAAEQYPVPPEGPERVLRAAVSGAAITELKSRRPAARVALAAAAALIVAAGIVVGGRVVGGGTGKGVASGVTKADRQAGAARAAPGVGGATTTGATTAPPQAAAPAAAESGGVSADVERHLVVTGEVTVRVSDPDAAAARLQAIASDAGGFVEAETKESLTLRVPAGRLGEVMTAATRAGDVLGTATSARDVTAERDALVARIAELRAQLAGVSPDRRTALESELRSREEELRLLDRDVSLAVLLVKLVRA